MLGFLSATMSSTTQRFINYAEGSNDSESIKKTFNNSLILHQIIAGVSTILLLIAGIFFFNGILNIPEGQHNEAVIVYGCLIVSTIFSITITPYDAVIVAHENMAFYSLLGIIDVLLKLAIAIAILFLSQEQLIIYAILLAVESTIIRVIAKYYCQRKYAECKNPSFKYYDNALIKQMSSFAGWNMANITTGMISLYGTNIVINHYFGTELNAAMGIATQLSGVLMGISANLLKAITPALTKAEGGHNRDKMLELSYVGCKFSFLILSFICIPVILYLPYLLDLWLNNPPNLTTVFCVISIISTLIDQPTVLLYQSIMAEGNIRGYSIIRSISNLLPIIISIIMFSVSQVSPIWGLLNWAIWKSAIGCIINLIYSQRNLGLSITTFCNKVYTRCVAGMLPCVVIGFSIQHFLSDLPSIAQISVLIFFSAPIYWYFSLAKSERSSLSSQIKNKLIKF